MLAAGDRAPDFDVSAHDGTRTRLAELLAGKYVLVWFYPEADTPGCTIEGNGFRDRFRDFAAAGIVVLGASFDSVAKNRAFADKFAYPFPLLSFELASDPFGVEDPNDPGWPRRVSFLIAPDGTIAKVFDPVVPDAHPAEVLSHLA